MGEIRNGNMMDDPSDEDGKQKQISDFEIALAEDLMFQKNSQFNPFLLAESIIKRASQHEQE